MKNKKILGILIAMLIFPATLKINAMKDNTNNNGNNFNKEFFDISENKKEFKSEFNETFEDLLKDTIKFRIMEGDLKKYYDSCFNDENLNKTAFINSLIEKFKEDNRKYFENRFKHLKEKKLFLNIYYYERLINLIYEYCLKSFISNIETLGANNVSNKTKLATISKYEDEFVENINNCVIKRVTFEKVNEKKKNLNNLKDLNEIAPLMEFETFSEYEDYSNNISQLEYNAINNPNNANNLSLIYDVKDVRYETVNHVIHLTINAIFREEGLN